MKRNPSEGGTSTGREALVRRAFRLASGVRPQFDRHSRIVYLLIGGALLLKVALFDFGGFTSGAQHPWDLLLLCAFPVVPALMIRRVGHNRTATAIEAVCLLAIAGLVGVQLQFPIVAKSLWLADSFLLQVDRLLGFDWLGFSLAFSAPPVWAFLDFSYACFRPEALLVIASLCLWDRTPDVWQFLVAYVLALLVSVLCLYFFAATGQFVLCGLRPLEIPVSGALCDYCPIIETLRDGSMRTIRTGAWVGLVSLPSFRVAAAALMQWHLRHDPWLRWPALVVNVGMAIGAIVVGSHYFIDILAGLALAALCGWAARQGIAAEHNPG